MEGLRDCVETDALDRCVVLARQRMFTFDHVFGVATRQVRRRGALACRRSIIDCFLHITPALLSFCAAQPPQVACFSCACRSTAPFEFLAHPRRVRRR